MRVGRYGDPCKRYISENLKLVDDKAADALYKKLIRFTEKSKPVAPAKRGPSSTLRPATKWPISF